MVLQRLPQEDCECAVEVCSAQQFGSQCEVSSLVHGMVPVPPAVVRGEGMGQGGVGDTGTDEMRSDGGAAPTDDAGDAVCADSRARVAAVAAAERAVETLHDEVAGTPARAAARAAAERAAERALGPVDGPSPARAAALAAAEQAAAVAASSAASAASPPAAARGRSDWLVEILGWDDRGDHDCFVVQLTVDGGNPWTVFRRYREFVQLHAMLQEACPHLLDGISLPPKGLFKRRSVEFLERRQGELQR